jgi:hypothetical protein
MVLRFSFVRLVAIIGVFAGLGCGGAVVKPVVQSASEKRSFTVLPAESDRFPEAARVTTDRLQRARLRGFEEPQLSKVSLEVVQLAIECVEPSLDCWAAVGKELSAQQLLFAVIAPGPRPESVKVTVTLFDVDEKKQRRAVEKVFATEQDVPYSIADVVAEATKP